MKNAGNFFVAIMLLMLNLFGSGVAEASRVLPTGDGKVTCLDYGIEMRDANQVKSCLLALPGDFIAVGKQPIACLAKFAAAFAPDGKVEYCTIGFDMKLRSGGKTLANASAGGRVALYPNGSPEVAVLKESMKLSYSSTGEVPCRGGAKVTFRSDGKVSTCVLDQESLFIGIDKKKTANTCQAGGMIAFDDDGAFGACYPPPPVKEAVKATMPIQGGVNP